MSRAGCRRGIIPAAVTHPPALPKTPAPAKVSKNAIINVASYTIPHGGQARIEDSVREYDVDVYGWTAESQVNAPVHGSNPYAFKPHAFAKMFTETNYDNVLWLDASIWAIRDVRPIFDKVEQQGYLVQSCSSCKDPGNTQWWSVGDYTNDETLSAYGLTRDDAMQL